MESHPSKDEVTAPRVEWNAGFILPSWYSHCCFLLLSVFLPFKVVCWCDNIIRNCHSKQAVTGAQAHQEISACFVLFCFVNGMSVIPSRSVFKKVKCTVYASTKKKWKAAEAVCFSTLWLIGSHGCCLGILPCALLWQLVLRFTSKNFYFLMITKIGFLLDLALIWQQAVQSSARSCSPHYQNLATHTQYWGINLLGTLSCRCRRLFMLWDSF